MSKDWRKEIKDQAREAPRPLLLILRSFGGNYGNDVFGRFRGCAHCRHEIVKDQQYVEIQTRAKPKFHAGCRPDLWRMAKGDDEARRDPAEPHEEEEAK